MELALKNLLLGFAAAGDVSFDPGRANTRFIVGGLKQKKRRYRLMFHSALSSYEFIVVERSKHERKHHYQVINQLDVETVLHLLVHL